MVSAISEATPYSRWNGNRVVALETRAKILAFEHARQPVMAAQADDVVAGELVEPLAVVANFGFHGIEEFEDLREVSLSVCANLFACQRRAGFGLSRGVANHRGEIANQEDGGVSKVLKMLQLAEDDGVAEMNVGRRGVHAEIHAQGCARFQRLLKLGGQLRFGNDFGDAFF